MDKLNVNEDVQEYHFGPFATQFCHNIEEYRPFFLFIETFIIQFCPADWPFQTNEFEPMKTVWPFVKISDRPFLRNTVVLPYIINPPDIDNSPANIFFCSNRFEFYRSHRGLPHPLALHSGISLFGHTRVRE